MKARSLLLAPFLVAFVPFACAHVGDVTDAGGAAGSPGPNSTGGRSSSGGHSNGGQGGTTEGGAGGLGGKSGADPCCILGAICHVVGGSDDPMVDECHEIGHENDTAQCVAHFDRCHELCEGLTDDPKPHACFE